MTKLKRIIVFGASSSRNSINIQLAIYAARQYKIPSVEIFDLNDFEMPIFSVDVEATSGIPEKAHELYFKFGNTDLIIISFTENDGEYIAAFNNIFEWTSRVDSKLFQGKPTLLLATSTGAFGGSSLIEIAKNRFPDQGAAIKGSFYLPNFYQNFDDDFGILNEEYKNQLLDLIKSI